MTTPDDLLTEDREAYYIDAKDRVWTFDLITTQWTSPDLPYVTCSWVGLTCLSSSLRMATPHERKEIDEELFS